MNFKMLTETGNDAMEVVVDEIQVGDMLVQDKDSEDRKIYLAAEILGGIKLINVNNGQTYNKVPFNGKDRQEVLDIVADHFPKHGWTYIPVDAIKSKDFSLVLKDDFLPYIDDYTA